MMLALNGMILIDLSLCALVLYLYSQLSTGECSFLCTLSLNARFSNLHQQHVFHPIVYIHNGRR